jgi:uncharacterized protein RhaS with RHS repeats
VSTTESYSYDAVGNRLSSSGVPTYSYNASNELTSNSSGSYVYDNNGNTLTDASSKSFTWDFENRMVQAVGARHRNDYLQVRPLREKNPEIRPTWHHELPL